MAMCDVEIQDMLRGFSLSQFEQFSNFPDDIANRASSARGGQVLDRIRWSISHLMFGSVRPTLIISSEKLWKTVNDWILPPALWRNADRKEPNFTFSSADWIYDARCQEDQVYLINEKHVSVKRDPTARLNGVVDIKGLSFP
jgi:hypothetical protein